MAVLPKKLTKPYLAGLKPSYINSGYSVPKWITLIAGLVWLYNIKWEKKEDEKDGKK